MGEVSQLILSPIVDIQGYFATIFNTCCTDTESKLYARLVSIYIVAIQLLKNELRAYDFPFPLDHHDRYGVYNALDVYLDHYILTYFSSQQITLQPYGSKPALSLTL